MSPLSLVLFALFAIVLAQTDMSLVYNPGPKHKCYDFLHSSACAQNEVTTPFHQDCSITPNAPSFMAGWYNGNLPSNGDFPGGNGTPMNITLVNRAVSSEADCSVSCGALKEVQFEYTYPGFGIRKDSHDNQYNLALYDQWIVEYDVTIHRNGDCPECDQWYDKCYNQQNEIYPGVCQVPGQGQGAGCKGYMRQYLTTDFIYYWSIPGGQTYKNLISIIHYNPIQTGAHVGPFQVGDGFRIAVNGPPGLVPGKTTRVSLDFRALVEQYSAQLCHGGNGRIPSGLSLYSLQIVSSNVNTSSTIDITNTNIILRNDPDPNIQYPKPTATYPTPTYCPALPARRQASKRQSSSGTCSVSYEFTSTWATGYTVDVKIANTGSSPITGWNLVWDMPGNDQIANSWSSSYYQSGTTVYAQNDQNNRLIAGGRTVDFGFNVNRDSTMFDPVKPGSFFLNGQQCSIVY